MGHLSYYEFIYWYLHSYQIHANGTFACVAPHAEGQVDTQTDRSLIDKWKDRGTSMSFDRPIDRQLERQIAGDSERERLRTKTKKGNKEGKEVRIREEDKKMVMQNKKEVRIKKEG